MDFFKFASLNKQDFSDNRNIGLFFKSVQLAFPSILYKQIKIDLSYLVLIRQREVRVSFTSLETQHSVSNGKGVTHGCVRFACGDGSKLSR